MQGFNKDVIVSLVPHRIIPDKDNYIVEHLLNGEFYEMPRLAIEAIEQLSKGNSLNQVEHKLICRYPDEEIDMEDFFKQLQEMDFITRDNNSLASGGEFDSIIEPGNLHTSSSKIGQLLFHMHVIPIYGIILCANIFFFIFVPDLFPHPHDLFPFDSIVADIVISMLISIVLLTVHESGHVLAARVYGLEAKVRLGHRLLLIVLETDMPRIWSLPRTKRNIPLLAGLCIDHTLLLLTLSLLTFVPLPSSTLEAILEIVVLQLFMMSIYQCLFFMKTDLYYVFQNVSGCYNLLENTEGWLKAKIPFLRLKNTAVIYEKERNIVRGYAVFYIIGLFASGAIFVFYVIPQLIYSFTISFDHLIHSPSSSMKIDAILFFIQFVIIAGILLYSWFKKYIAQ